jgi:cysteine-rich repeat protein
VHGTDQAKPGVSTELATRAEEAPRTSSPVATSADKLPANDARATTLDGGATHVHFQLQVDAGSVADDDGGAEVDLPFPPLCGNGKLDPGESCDDANTQSNDGCSARCMTEPDWNCEGAGFPCYRNQPGDPDCSQAACREQSSCYEPSGLACGCLDGPQPPPACGELALRSLGSPKETLGWRAYSISRDGEVVVGHGDYGHISKAVAWSAARGTQVAPVDLPSAIASADGGSVILVTSDALGITNNYLWRNMDTVESIDLPAPGWLTDVSADGSVVVGTLVTTDMSYQAFRWTAQSGAVTLAPSSSDAIATNADGSIVLLSMYGGVARWTAANGSQLLPYDVAGVGFGDLSDDGSVLVGRNVPEANGPEWAVRWAGSELEDLGTLAASRANLAPGDVLYDWASAVNSDGSVVVGMSDQQAMIWTPSTGLRALRDVLAEQGVDVQPWVLEEAVGVSADGKMVAGNGHCQGRRVPFVAHLK